MHFCSIKKARSRPVQPVPSRPGSGSRVRPSVRPSARLARDRSPLHLRRRTVLQCVPTRVEPVFPTRVANPGSPLNGGVLYVRF